MTAGHPSTDSPYPAIEAAEALLDCLKREYHALTGRDPAAIEAIAREKHDRLLRLDAETRQHRAHGQPLAARLTALLGECEHHNRVNGSIIEVSRQHVQRALALVRGQNPDAALYGPQGDTRLGGASRSLARA